MHGRYILHGLGLAAILATAGYFAFRNDPRELENIKRASEASYPSPAGVPMPVRKEKLTGRVVHENLFAPIHEFGLVYRIEVSNDDADVQRQIRKYVEWMRGINPHLEERQFGLPYVFVGEAKELQEMDSRINEGDVVTVDDTNVNMWSIDRDPVLTPDKLEKQ